MSIGSMSLSWAFLALLGQHIIPTLAQLPYTPTTIFQSFEDPQLLYSFRPSASGSHELASLNVSGNLDASDLQYSTLSADLPFLDGQTDRPYTPALARDGSIAVYTGDCDAGSKGAQVWRYMPSDDGTRSGEWTQQALTATSLTNDAGGAKYLTSAISFASVMQGSETASNLYILGGLCPFDNATAQDWQEAASYSNTMLSIEADQDHSVSSYNIQSVATREPLIAQAGCALTPLPPTYSNRSDGKQTQQQDFVLMGGQTQMAWINMSRIALFSLPQESWSYIDVAGPDTSRTDLAVRTDISEIQPRSGHTAVLSEDGQTITVFGGWVGDVGTPAQPQLAVLNIGSEYGGKGDWAWSVPETSGAGPLANGGVYGHGAVLLPGGIMMVTGGFDIPGTSSRTRRQAQASQNTYFLNTAGNSWSNSYTPPAAGQPISAQETSSGPLSTPAQKAGLGVGIAIGVLVLIALIVVLIWWKRRHAVERRRRDQDLNNLARTTHRLSTPEMSEMIRGGGFDGRGGNPYAVYYDNDAIDRHGGWKRSHGQEAERTGLLLDIPSPTRGLRRGLQSRPVYNDSRMVRSGGYVNPPIDEEDEEEVPTEERQDDTSSGDSRPKTADRASLMAGGLNPLGSNPVEEEGSPALEAYRSRQSSRGYSNEELADTVPELQHVGHASGHGSFFKDTSSSSSSSAGRASPTKSSDRTDSNLSERSVRSNLSAQSSSAFSFHRSASMRSANLLAANVIPNPFSTPEASPTKERHPDELHPSKIIRPGTGSSDSFATAHSSFTKLQAESQALLGGALAARADSSALSLRYKDDENSEPEEFEMRPHRQRGNSILGNVRRAIGRTVIRNNTADSRRSLAGTIISQRSTSLSNRLSQGSPTKLTPSDPIGRKSGSGSSSPPKRHSGIGMGVAAPGPEGIIPRRANSDAAFWRAQTHKRGSRAWEDDYDESSEQYRAGDDWGDPQDLIRRREAAVHAARENEGEGRDSGEWDVEGAAGRRDVQMMSTFTVPRQRLRCVNLSPEDAERGSLLSGRESVASMRSRIEERERAAGDGGEIKVVQAEEMVLKGKGKKRAE